MIAFNTNNTQNDFTSTFIDNLSGIDESSTNNMQNTHYFMLANVNFNTNQVPSSITTKINPLENEIR